MCGSRRFCSHISFDGFLELLGSGDSTSGSMSDDLKAIVNDIRKALNKNLGREVSIKRLKEAFSEIDTDGSNTLDPSELCRALRILDIDVSRAEASEVVAFFDKNNDNEIDFDEFLHLLGSGDGYSGHGKQVQGLISKGLRSSIQNLFQKYQSSTVGEGTSRKKFDEYDENNSGTISKKEFKAAMKEVYNSVKKRSDVSFDEWIGEEGLRQAYSFPIYRSCFSLAP